MSEWLNNFVDRQQKEIEFATLYAKDFAHGTNGHNALIIIAKMAELLDNMEQRLLDDTAKYR